MFDDETLCTEAGFFLAAFSARFVFSTRFGAALDSRGATLPLPWKPSSVAAPWMYFLFLSLILFSNICIWREVGMRLPQSKENNLLPSSVVLAVFAPKLVSSSGSAYTSFTPGGRSLWLKIAAKCLGMDLPYALVLFSVFFAGSLEHVSVASFASSVIIIYSFFMMSLITRNLS